MGGRLINRQLFFAAPVTPQSSESTDMQTENAALNSELLTSLRKEMIRL